MRTFEDVARGILADAVISVYVIQRSEADPARIDPTRVEASRARARTDVRNVAHMLGLDDRREEFRKAEDIMWDVIRERVATLPDRGWITDVSKERDAARWAIACEALRQASAKCKNLNLSAPVVKEGN
jgi:hypothetical protein